MTKRRRTVVVLGFIFALVGLLGFTGATPAAHAGNAPPVFADGHGLTVVKQPWWVDGAERTFKFVVRTVEVPEYSTMAGQNSGST